jgi:hypothetical protein
MIDRRTVLGAFIGLPIVAAVARQPSKNRLATQVEDIAAEIKRLRLASLLEIAGAEWQRLAGIVVVSTDDHEISGVFAEAVNATIEAITAVEEEV